MLIARKGAAANVIDGKIYVYVGFSSVYNNGVNGGEIYDPKTQTWEPFPQGEEDFSNKEGVTRCAFCWIIERKKKNRVRETYLFSCEEDKNKTLFY